MNVDDAFDQIDKIITPSARHEATTRERIARFTEVLQGLDGGIEVAPSGSWARRTALGPVHDVDLIVVFAPDRHPDWDGGPGTAEAALRHVEQAINAHLSERHGGADVWDTELRDHVVRCYLDSQSASEEPASGPFAVEVMPAIRAGSTLRVPERREDRWRTVDPEHLVRESAVREREWPHYPAMVRLLKHWTRQHPELAISSLAVEVLALTCLPRPPLIGSLSRTEALKGFFHAAAAQVMTGVRDPAGHRGEIAPGIKRRQARETFLRMADLAAAAAAWQRSDHEHGDDVAVHFLRLIFGGRFPKPSRDWTDVPLEVPWIEAPGVWSHRAVAQPAVAAQHRPREGGKALGERRAGSDGTDREGVVAEDGARLAADVRAVAAAVREAVAAFDDQLDAVREALRRGHLGRAASLADVIVAARPDDDGAADAHGFVYERLADSPDPAARASARARAREGAARALTPQAREWVLLWLTREEIEEGIAALEGGEFGLAAAVLDRINVDDRGSAARYLQARAMYGRAVSELARPRPTELAAAAENLRQAATLAERAADSPEYATVARRLLASTDELAQQVHAERLVRSLQHRLRTLQERYGNRTITSFEAAELRRALGGLRAQVQAAQATSTPGSAEARTLADLHRAVTRIHQVVGGVGGRTGPAAHDAPTTGTALSIETAAAEARAAAAEQEAAAAARAAAAAARAAAREARSAARYATPADASAGTTPAAADTPVDNDPSADRYLVGELPGRVQVSTEFSVIVRITASRPPGSIPAAPMRPMSVGPDGVRILIVITADAGVLGVDTLEQTVIVPPTGDSQPVRFPFRARAVGLRQIRASAWNQGTLLGELTLQVSVEPGSTGAGTAGQRRWAPLRTLAAEPGEVTMQVHCDGERYSFQLHSAQGLFKPVLARSLTAAPGAAVERTVAMLRRLASDTADYPPRTARRWVQETGVGLWRDMVPEQIQEQFFLLRDHIRTFTIATDNDVIPWELLYPLSQTQDHGFLVQQFPVLRWTYGQLRVPTVSIDAARYVVPPNSPRNAQDEIVKIQQILGADSGKPHAVAELDQLMALLDSADAGLLHFACHNTFAQDSGGSSIRMDGGAFVPLMLNSAVARRTLAKRRPLVFLNACRTAGVAPEYTQMMGWAGQFMAAGAGAFVGTLWPVRSSSAGDFAAAFYGSLRDGNNLGTAALDARRVIEDDADPTWLAYSVYGDPYAVGLPNPVVA